MTYILFVAGFFLVIYGANYLVDGAASLAKKFNVSNIVIGLTVVAFGTSAPELVVTVVASMEGNNDIALGNVVGSNILNVLLILGISSIVYPLTVHKNTVWKEIPLALLAAIMIFILGSDLDLDNERVDYLSTVNSQIPLLGAIGKIDGLVLLAFFIVFLYYAFASAREVAAENGAEAPAELPTGKSLLYTLLGLIGLVLGGRWIVSGAVDISLSLGMSEKLVGLTIVAFGTSLPELVTSIVAARKKQTDIAIGNVVGSNIFNTFFILGTAAVLSPVSINANTQIDALVNVGSSILLFSLLFVGKRHTIGRPEGIIFLLGYITYTVYLIWRG